MERKIKLNWHPPKSNEGDKVRVLFTIDRDGSMSDLHILQSGNSAKANEAALDAVSNASSGFEPLPKGAPEDVKIEFTFKYNVLNSHHNLSQEPWH